MLDKIPNRTMKEVAELVQRIGACADLVVGQTRQGDLVYTGRLRNLDERDNTLFFEALVGHQFLEAEADHLWLNK